VAIVLKDFILLEATAAHLGLDVKRSKCEVVGHTESHDAELPESSVSTVIFLGSSM